MAWALSPVSPTKASATPKDARPVRPAEPAAAASAPGAAADYRNAVLARINARKRYPDMALERGARGVAVVSFTLDDAGQIVSATLAKSAGDPALDNDAVATVRRAAPFGAPPPGAPRAFTAPLNYTPR